MTKWAVAIEELVLFLPKEIDKFKAVSGFMGSLLQGISGKKISAFS